MKELGTEISNQRKAKGMTQQNLAKKICTQPGLSMIEQGEVKPSLENIFYFSMKLHQPIDHFLMFLTENRSPSEIKRHARMIEQCIQNHDFETAYRIIQQELSYSTAETTSWYRHYLLWRRAVCRYSKGEIEAAALIYYCKELLSEEYDIILPMHQLSVRILNTIASVYSENGDREQALIYYEKALNDTENWNSSSSAFQPAAFRLRMLYNKAKTLYDNGDYDQAVLIIHQGLDESRAEEVMSLLGNFYYYLGQCFEKQQKPFEEIAAAYQQAKWFFEFLGRRTYLNILLDLKKNYIV